MTKRDTRPCLPALVYQYDMRITERDVSPIVRTGNVYHRVTVIWTTERDTRPITYTQAMLTSISMI